MIMKTMSNDVPKDKYMGWIHKFVHELDEDVDMLPRTNVKAQFVNTVFPGATKGYRVCNAKFDVILKL